MDEQDYPIRHFAWMVEFATELKSLPAQVFDHGYSYESFASWSAIVRYRGVPFRVLFDGKEGELLVQRSMSRKAPYDWEAPSWQRASRSGEDLTTREIVDAIRSVASDDRSSINCGHDGRQGIGLVCEHIAFAFDRGDRIGFFWGDDTDTVRPDAWCAECERALVALKGASSEQWFRDAGFKIFCARCWDEAKVVCGGFPRE